jgi:hypothetical protein
MQIRLLHCLLLHCLTARRRASPWDRGRGSCKARQSPVPLFFPFSSDRQLGPGFSQDWAGATSIHGVTNSNTNCWNAWRATALDPVCHRGSTLAYMNAPARSTCGRGVSLRNNDGLRGGLLMRCVMHLSPDFEHFLGCVFHDVCGKERGIHRLAIVCVTLQTYQ